jgi:hypothetical protein
MSFAYCGCDCEECLVATPDHRCECRPLGSDSPVSDSQSSDSSDREFVASPSREDDDGDSSYVPQSSPQSDSSDSDSNVASPGEVVAAAMAVEELLSSEFNLEGQGDAEERRRELIEHISTFYA